MFNSQFSSEGTEKTLFMRRRQALGMVIGLFAILAGCGRKKTVVGVDVDLYLHPSSTDPSDILLQTAITKRLADSATTRQSMIRVIVADRAVTLTGTARSQSMIDDAARIAQQTELTLNGDAIRPKTPVTNKITLSN